MKTHYEAIKSIYTVDVILTLLSVSLSLIGFISEVDQLKIISVVALMLPSFLLELICLMQRVIDRNYRVIRLAYYMRLFCSVLVGLFGYGFLVVALLSVNGENRFVRSDVEFFSGYLSQNLIWISCFYLMIGVLNLVPCYALRRIFGRIDEMKIEYRQEKMQKGDLTESGSGEQQEP